MKNKNDSIKKQKNKSGKHIAAIVGLSVTLGLAVAAAIAVPLVVKKGGDTPGPGVKSHTVTFNADGGTFEDGSSTKTQKVVDGELMLQPVCTKAGSYITGWYNGSTKWNFNTDKVTADVTLKAQWATTPVVTYYTVTFNGNGGTFDGGTPTKTTSIEANTTIPFAPSCTYDGYKLTGWKDPDGNVWNFTTSKVTKNTTLTAQWEAVQPVGKTYTVTFDSDGGSTVPKQEVLEGKTAVEPVPPTKTDNTFAGWYDEAGKIFNFSTAINANIKLTAHWTPVVVTTATITYLSGDHGTFAGSAKSAEITVTKDSQFQNCIKPGVEPDDGWAFTGWVDTQGDPVSATAVISTNTTIKAAYQANPKKVSVQLKGVAGPTDSPWDVSLKGIATFTVDSPATYASVINNFPVATCANVDGQIPSFKHWSKNRQTETDPEKLPEAIKSTDPIGENDVLYPVFDFEAATEIVTLNVNLLEGQSILPGKGSTTIQVPYKAGTTEYTFGQVSKPEIYESGKVFSKYYKSHDGTAFSSPWASDDPITPDGDHDIYVEMVEPVTDPIITFEWTPTTEMPKDCKWVGNKEIKIVSGTKFADIAAPNVYYDATENPNPALGFLTDWYFTGWYKKGDTEKTPIVDGDKFTTSTTLCPMFELKTNVVIQTYKTGETATDPKEGRYLPSYTWGDVVKPTTISGLAANDWLVGWQGVSHLSGQTIDLTDSTKINEIELNEEAAKEKSTVTITPKVVSEDQCHMFKFYNKAFVEGVTSTKPTQDVTYVGALNVGILKSSEEKIVVDASLNKPLIPSTDESGAQINKGLTFENKWKYTTESDPTTATNWQDLDSSLEIPAGSANLTYHICPVVTSNITITYDKGEHGEIAEWKSGEKITTASVAPGTAFANIYRPDVNPSDGYTFQYWAYKDADGKYIKVDQDKTFSENTTLYAIYATSDVYSTVNFRVAQTDIEDPSFPATPINDDNCFKVTIKDLPSNIKYFSDFATQKLPTKPCHKLVGWYYIDEDGKEVDITSPTTLAIPQGGDGFNVYARFEQDGTYHRITIKENSAAYTIDGDKELYAQAGTNPVDPTTKQLKPAGSTFDSAVWAVGKKIVGWKQSDGKTDLPTYIDQDYLDVIPVFDDADPIYIKFYAPDGVTLSSNTEKAAKIHDKLINYINDSSWIPTATKAKGTFTKWAIYNGEGEENTTITNDMRVENTVTLVPEFIDESIYEGSNDAYFYDEDKKMWAAIKEYVVSDWQHINDMKVTYSDGTTGYVAKDTFNYEIKFGSQLTMLPDNFMKGCTLWNNGGKPFYFPTSYDENKSNVVGIGKNVMEGCTSFNQDIYILASTADSGELEDTFVIGQNFMRNCISFNSNITIKYIPHTLPTKPGDPPQYSTGKIAWGDGFMFNCFSFNKTLDISTWSAVGHTDWLGNAEFDDLTEATFYTCLASDDPRQVPNFKVLVHADFKTSFNGLFPTMAGPVAGHTERWTYRTITVQ